MATRRWDPRRQDETDPVVAECMTCGPDLQKAATRVVLRDGQYVTVVPELVPLRLRRSVAQSHRDGGHDVHETVR